MKMGMHLPPTRRAPCLTPVKEQPMTRLLIIFVAVLALLLSYIFALAIAFGDSTPVLALSLLALVVAAIVAVHLREA